MSEVTVQELFDEFALRYLRGEAPDVQEYLGRGRTGAEQDDLADLIDRFLQAMPARRPTEEEVVLMQARLEKEPPLLVLRVRRAIAREAVVDALMRTLGLDPAKRDKVAGYYHELEVGTLDPNPVSSRIWDALGEFLHANVRLLAGLRPPPHLPEGAVFHRLELRESIQHLASWDDAADGEEAESAPAPGRERPDEVDRLFTGSA